MKYLEISDLSFKRGGFALHASLGLDRGSTGIILGPSGCGKTTLLRCVAGLERPDEGRIAVDGADISALPPEKRNLGFIFQDLALFDHLSGRKNIEFGLKMRKASKEQTSKAIESLAQKLKIEALLDRKPFSLSGGEKQRLAFARALATKPELLLMDEPLSSLDAPLRRDLRAYLRSTLSREGVTSLHVTHDVEEALELGDEIFIMNQGHIVSRGSPREIFETPSDAWCVRFLGLGFLLKVKSMEAGNGKGIANTSFGRFEFPLGNRRASMEIIGGGTACFYIPKRALALQPGTGARQGAAPTLGFLDAVVETIVFQGTFQKVALMPLPPENSPYSAESSENTVRVDIELDASVPLKKGERARFSINPERCAILPPQVAS